MDLRRVLGCLVVTVLLCGGVASQAQSARPADLEGWSDWVLHDWEFVRCPVRYDQSPGNVDAHHCRVPGPLGLQLDATGGRFQISWQVVVAGFVQLPGSAEAWPVSVSVDGRPAAVLPGSPGPRLWLEPGLHQIVGELSWSERPQSLELPSDVARLSVEIDGRAVSVPERRGSQLWLGGGEIAVSEADALRVEVYRLLVDELPLNLTTRLNLTVSGKAREVMLGPVLPSDFVGTAVSGTLAARLEADGRLRVQLAPGNHWIEVAARALNAVDSVGRGGMPANDWPQQEVWSFNSGPVRGPVDANGGEPVDPANAGVPGPWQSYPAYLMLPEQALTIVRPALSIEAMAANRLSLQRRLWLDFDAGGWTATDTLQGEMRQDWRLDALPALQLQRASSDGDALLLTASPLINDAVGVEWRQSQVGLQATSRLDGGYVLPVSGWNQVLDEATLTLNLPPSYQLLAAPGADSANSAWIARWGLGDVFLLCLGGLMAWRLGGWVLALVTVSFLLLSFDHRDAPMLSVLLLLLTLLLGRWAEGYRIGVWLTRLGYIFMLIVACVALPYAAAQLSLALHPQLERYSVESSVGFNRATSKVIGSSSRYRSVNAFEQNEELAMANDDMAGAAAPAPADNLPPPKMLRSAPSPKVITAQEHQQHLQQSLNRIDPKAVVQAGGAEPQWSWVQHRLSVTGPVAVDQQVRLIMTPPWLTRLWRVIAVAVMALLLLATMRRLAPPSLSAKLPAWTLLALLVAGPAGAGEYPSPELLTQLRERLTVAPDCAPQCSQLADARVRINDSTLSIELSLHAGAAVSVPLPSAPGWQPARVEVDGTAHDWLLLQGDQPWVSLPAGVRKVRMEGAIAGDQLRLSFPMSPARISAESEAWLVSGVQRGRLPSGALELNRQQRSARTEEVRRESDLPAYVKVTRLITIDLDWTVTTRVDRVAPSDAAINVAIPLLAGERLLAEDPPLRDGAAQISLAPGRTSMVYQGRLEPNSPLQLTAPPLAQHLETWMLAVSPIFHAEYDGPVALLVDGAGASEPVFHPLPGDQLSISVTRPEAVAGSTLAIDGVGLTTRYGSRLRESALSISLRATRGGQHALQLPPNAELVSLSIDGKVLRVRPEAGRLLLPISPGEHTVEMELREALGISMYAGTAEIDLGLPAANVGMQMTLPDDRWLLATGGPQVGPAVRYWSILLLVVIVALALGRAPGSPVRTRDWLILGIGLSTVAWPALIVVAVWLYLLDWRRQKGAELAPWRFAAVQIGLVGFSAIVLIMLVVTAWGGLLGDPKMVVQGNGSSSTILIWFADHVDGPLPSAWAFSLPLWVYKAAILVWSLWLANALIDWLRRAFDALGSGGWWKTLSRPGKKPEPETSDLREAPVASPAELPAGNLE